LGGLTIESSPLFGTRLIVAAAAAIPRSPGSWNFPALFWIFANLSPFFSE
jgi:hypothetical protein